MSDNNWGHGLRDAVDLQRQFNELELLLWRQIQLSAGEDPAERIKQIAAAQAEFREQVDELLAARAKGEEK